MKTYICILLFLQFGLSVAFGQTFKPAMEGIAPLQDESSPGFDIKFKNNLMGRDWIYGSYVDQDSLTRCVAYRKGGRWVPLPFSGYYGNNATDMAMYGDTLYIAGNFGDVVQDNSTDTLPKTGILKYYNDSIWAGDGNVSPKRMYSRGDSMLIWGGAGTIQNPIYPHAISYDKGQNWQYPYSIGHPTGDTSTAGSFYFGAISRIEILPNGDILTLNNGSPPGSPYKGVVRWDGNQWHNYGNGIYGGGYTHALDFDFYRGELYMGGTFDKVSTYHGDTVSTEPRNPGNAVVRWDGTQWQSLAGGILEGGLRDMFVHNDVLYCQTFAGVPDYHLFGDAQIPNIAGWDGSQWCGTPLDYNFFPLNYGIVNDTLFMVVKFVYWSNPTVNGHLVSYINYFDGDYLHGPNAICSISGLGEGEPSLAKEEIQIYPNPAHELLNISLPQQTAGATYELLALDGKLMQRGILAKGENTLKITSKLSGVFLLKIETQNGVLVKKVFFEK